MKLKNHYILLLLFVLYGFLLIPLGNYKNPEQEHRGYYNIQKVDPGDDTAFYAYLRSGVIDGDFDFFNEKRYWHFDTISKTGYTANHWYIGAPILWFPFFLIGHGVAWLYGKLGYPVTADGYSFPYHAFTFLASAFEVFVALILCYRILKKFHSRSASLAATVLVFSSTCLPYFTFIRNRMSHSGDMLVGFVFFLLFVNFRDRWNTDYGSRTGLPSLSFFIFWGVLAGLLVDLRYISVVYCVLPLGMALTIFLAPETTDAEKRVLKQGIGLAFLAFLITISPQLASWKKLHGVFSSLNPFTVVIGPSVESVARSVWQLFFGGTRGLALTEPVWLFGLAGLVLVFIRDRLLGGLCWLLFLGFCAAPVVIGDPATLGQRYLIPAFPALAMGLGQLIDVLFKKRLQVVVVTVACGLSLWFYVLLLNYTYLLPYNDADFALRSFQNIPILIGKKNLLMPTTYLDLYLAGGLRLVDFLDYFFLIIFSILLVGIPVLLLLLVRGLASAFRRDEIFLSRTMRNLSAVFLGSMALLTTFILIRHPELPPETKKERLQIAAASELVKDSAGMLAVNTLLRRAEELAPPDERDYLIRADAALLNRNFDKARQFYLKAIALNDRSTANLQLDRIKVILKEKIDIDALLEDFKAKDDPTGEITRWVGIYYLDQLLKPDEAVAYFNASLQINPLQKEAAGMKRMIAQYITQLKRLQDRHIAPSELPVELNLMLNTDFNEIRLTTCMIPQRF